MRTVGRLLGAAAIPTAGAAAGYLLLPRPLADVFFAGWVLAGVGSAALGGSFVYLGAVARPLFGACARETLDCALVETHWDAVGMTVLGLLAVVVGS